jgi:colicin import membrane protein
LKKSGTIIADMQPSTFKQEVTKKIRETTEKAPKVADKITGEYNGKKCTQFQKYYINETEIKHTFRVIITDKCYKKTVLNRMLKIVLHFFLGQFKKSRFFY